MTQNFETVYQNEVANLTSRTAEHAAHLFTCAIMLFKERHTTISTIPMKPYYANVLASATNCWKMEKLPHVKNKNAAPAVYTKKDGLAENPLSPRKDYSSPGSSRSGKLTVEDPGVEVGTYDPTREPIGWKESRLL